MLRVLASVEVARIRVSGYGYTKDYPVERLMREAKLCHITEGTNQIQRVIIPRLLLG